MENVIKRTAARFGRLRRLVWALDAFEPMGPLVEASAELISGLRAQLGVEVQPAYVLSPAELNLPLEYSGQLMDRYLPNAEAALNQRIRQLADTGQISGPGSGGILPAHVILHESHSLAQAADAISDYAESTCADAIIVSTHGRAGVKRLFLGSFAETLLLRSKVPILIVPPDYHPTQKARGPEAVTHAILPTELDSRSKAVFGCAIELARGFGASVTLLHEVPHPIEPVVQSGVYLLGGGWIPVQAYFTEEVDRKARKGKAWARWATRQGVHCEAIVETGGVSISDRILELARAEQADLILMEAQTGRVAAALLGSIARLVIRSAPCPIWIIGPRAVVDKAAGGAESTAA